MFVLRKYRPGHYNNPRLSAMFRDTREWQGNRPYHSPYLKLLNICRWKRMGLYPANILCTQLTEYKHNNFL